MATDYDAPRRTETDDEPDTDAVGVLTARHTSGRTAAVDVDENDIGEVFELPGADLSGEELIVKAVPKQADEFTCTSCFLVNHRSRLAQIHGDQLICRDCV
jgi:hypothetical protein